MPTKKNNDDVLVTPIRKKAVMSGWKSAFDFEQQPLRQKKRATIETTSRFRKPKAVKKGSFQRKAAKVGEAPNLWSVVNAKPEIKKKATAEAEARERKRGEKKKMMTGRILVSKPAPKQLKGTWTNAINQKPVSIMKGEKSKNVGSQNNTKQGATVSANQGDWKQAYESILSPRSGKPKAVAKQDLVSEQIPSPKKKSRKPSPQKPSLLPLQPPLEDLPEIPSVATAKPPSPVKEKKPTATVKRKVEPVLIQPRKDEVEPAHLEPMKDQVQPVPIEPVKEKVRSVTIEPLEDEVEQAPDEPHVPSVIRSVESEPISLEDVDSKPLSNQYQHQDNIADQVEGEKPAPVLDTKTTADIPEDGAQIEKETENADEYMEYDEYTDNESENDSPVEVENTQHSHHTPPAKEKRQLLFEFALSPLEGEEDERDAGLVVPVDIQLLEDLSSIGSWPSIESDDSYDTRMNKMMQRWVDVHDGYDDDYEDRTLYNNDVDLENNVLDHIVLAAPDLEEAMAHFEALTGIRPNPVGPLQGLGARTAHVGLDNNRYIEILAPDNENPGPIGDVLKTLDPGTLTPWHYAIRSSEVSRLIEGYVYDVLGWEPDHIAMVQALPDNSIRQWDLLTMYGHDMGGCAPCYVKWNDHGQHPTATIALKATLETLTVRAPKNHDVHKLITGVDGINVEYGEPLLECTFATPNGRLTFSADHPRGLVFPGFDEHISEIPELLPLSGEHSCDEDWADVGYMTNESESEPGL